LHGEEFDLEDEMACLSSANEMTSFRKLVCGWSFGLMFCLCDSKRFLRCKNRGLRFSSADTDANCTCCFDVSFRATHDRNDEPHKLYIVVRTAYRPVGHERPTPRGWGKG